MMFSDVMLSQLVVSSRPLDGSVIGNCLIRDEDAPAQIPDEAAVKPDGWLDEEPEYIGDPSAVRPDDW